MKFVLTLLAVFAFTKWTESCSDGNCHSDPFPVRVIREVTISHGKAGASTSWRSLPWSDPENAFKQNIKQAWGSGIFPGDVRTPFPHLIWYEFTAEKAFVPAEVSFRPRQDGHLLAPTKWQFVGSNEATCDEKGAWAILCEDLSGIPFKNTGDSKFCVVPAHFNKKFRCLGVRILQSENGQEVCLQSMRFWEKVLD